MPLFDPEIKIEKETDTEAILLVGPLERGLGHTVGNSLRRVMLSYLSGAAVTEMRIGEVPHEFSTIKGVKEDVIELMLNVKRVNFKMDSLKPLIVTIEAEGVGKVKAGDLKCPAGLEILNKDLVLANLTDKKAKLRMELKVENGRGYALVDQQQAKVGVILIDADFSPVRKVAYRVEPVRKGRVSGLDQVVFEIVTDGSTTPRDALRQAAAVLEEHFSLLKEGAEVQVTWDETQEVKKEVEVVSSPPLEYLEELNLPTRLLNALKEAGVQTLEDIDRVGEEGLLKIKNVGPKSISLISKARETRTEKSVGQ
ncbi:DNA-directed RNA polymerase subunit alpha [Patescibacteria group bacterium]|nr:DNA-directed RNA polymerase subunit alpha [Patescibacteria group bacterium]MBU1868687.1 DNA-directed RNA polymerase subunit alpha [Patescibacteria group bacterium]